MKTQFKFLAYPVIAVASLLAATAALADDITPDNSAAAFQTPAQSRAQIQSQLMAARKDGSVKVWSTSYNPLTAAKSLKTREQVRAEVLAGRGDGFDKAWYGEDSGSFALNRGLQKSRDAAPIYAGVPKRSTQQ